MFYSSSGRKPNEIFVSDGSKCDIGRLQMMFGSKVSVALQDPAYPVYVDSSVIMGMTGEFNPSNSGFDGLEYMVCCPENDFFPDLSKVHGFLGLPLHCDASVIEQGREGEPFLPAVYIRMGHHQNVRHARDHMTCNAHCR